MTKARSKVLDTLPVVERRLSLNGIDTAVLEGGDGPPIVLLHGPSGYAAHWMEVIPSLAATNRVIAPDLPGHGASDACTGVPGSDTILGWLDDLIECTCSAPPIVVGQTLGGAIAARFAAERSKRLRALVLVDTLGLSAFQPLPEFGAALHEFMATPDERTHDRLWSQCAFNLPLLQDRLGRRWESLKAYNLERARAPGSVAAVSSLMEQFGLSVIPATTLARIAVPTTLIWGEQDRATTVHVVRAGVARDPGRAPAAGNGGMRAGSIDVASLDGGSTTLSAAVLHALSEQLAGKILSAGDAGWQESIQLWNGMTARTPALVIEPASALDVAGVVRFAGKHRLLLSIKGGGHHIAGTAIANRGLMLDMARLREIRVDASARLAAVGAGCRLQDVDAATQEHGLATVLGFISVAAWDT